MKSKLIFILVVCVLLGAGLYLTLKPTPKAPIASVQNAEKNIPQKTDPIQYLIQSLEKEPKGLNISPKTTEELRAYFAEATSDAVPRIFVQNLPTDFAEKGDKDLFADIISALILRENERMLTERAILILLKAKMNKGESWSDSEVDYFNSLVQKYDSKAKRVVSAELADLLNKLGTIPPLVAVAQAAVETDFGHQNLESPFGQTGWIDTRNYTNLKFDSLPKAIESYVIEMNGLPSLQDWRFLRESLRAQGRQDVGYRVLRVLGDYKQEDPLYAKKLQESVKTLGYEIPDSLSFLPWINFEKKSIYIQTEDRQILLQVEIAKTNQEQERGLMFRGSLAENSGMLFLNEAEEPYSMWMKNTYIPLDIVYFDKSGVIQTIIENAEPLTLESRPSVVPVLGAIELPAGFVQTHGIKVGDKVEY